MQKIGGGEWIWGTYSRHLIFKISLLPGVLKAKLYQGYKSATQSLSLGVFSSRPPQAKELSEVPSGCGLNLKWDWEEPVLNLATENCKKMYK